MEVLKGNERVITTIEEERIKIANDKCDAVVAIANKAKKEKESQLDKRVAKGTFASPGKGIIFGDIVQLLDTAEKWFAGFKAVIKDDILYANDTTEVSGIFCLMVKALACNVKNHNIMWAYDELMILHDEFCEGKTF